MNNQFRVDIVCLSTDTPPIDNLTNGSTKYAVDTKVLYVLYEGTWYEV